MEVCDKEGASHKNLCVLVHILVSEEMERQGVNHRPKITGTWGASRNQVRAVLQMLEVWEEGGEARLLHFKDGGHGDDGSGIRAAGNEEEQVGGVPFGVDSTLIRASLVDSK